MKKQNPREPETEEKKKGVKETNSPVFTPLFFLVTKIRKLWEDERDDKRVTTGSFREREEKREEERRGKETASTVEIPEQLPFISKTS